MAQPIKWPESPPLSFNTLPKLPSEIINRILWYWIAPQELVVTDTALDNEALVTYACSTDVLAAFLSPPIRTEYWRVRHLSRLLDAKTFTSPYDFYMSHHLLALHPLSTFPPLDTPIPHIFSSHADALTLLPHPLIPTHGLEKIILDFDASQYFALFDVRLPPFDTPSVPAPEYQGAASVLQHCRNLTLIFGEAYRYAHPWYNLDLPDWEEVRCRPHVCEMGKVVDWILEAAWRNGYLQHISEIKLQGEIQGWVRERWEGVFEEGLHEGEETVEWERPWDVYPPRCECKIGCWELGMEKFW